MLKLFGRKKEPVKVYCQNCGEDLTEIGGHFFIDIVGDRTKGIIFCPPGYKKDNPVRCTERYLADSPSFEILFANYMIPSQIQREIKRGRLTDFGPLEKSVSG